MIFGAFTLAALPIPAQAEVYQRYAACQPTPVAGDRPFPAAYNREWIVRLTGANMLRVDLEPQYRPGEKRDLPVFSGSVPANFTYARFQVQGDTRNGDTRINFLFNVEQAKTYLNKMSGILIFWIGREKPVGLKLNCIVPPMPPAAPSTPAPRRN